MGNLDILLTVDLRLIIVETHDYDITKIIKEIVRIENKKYEER